MHARRGQARDLPLQHRGRRASFLHGLRHLHAPQAPLEPERARRQRRLPRRRLARSIFREVVVFDGQRHPGDNPEHTHLYAPACSASSRRPTPERRAAAAAQAARLFVQLRLGLDLRAQLVALLVDRGDHRAHRQRRCRPAPLPTAAARLRASPAPRRSRRLVELRGMLRVAGAGDDRQVGYPAAHPPRDPRDLAPDRPWSAPARRHGRAASCSASSGRETSPNSTS